MSSASSFRTLCGSTSLNSVRRTSAPPLIFLMRASMRRRSASTSAGDRLLRLLDRLHRGVAALLHLGRPDEVHLVQEDAVDEGELFHGLVLDPLRLLLVQVLLDVLRVDDRDDAVQAALGADLLVRPPPQRTTC